MDFTFWLDEQSNEPLYLQLYQHIKEEIQYGNVGAGTKLPSIRRLSTHLSISKNTIEAAYQQLISEGYVESKERSGLYVVPVDGDIIPHQNIEQHLFEEDWNHEEKTYTYDFRQGRIDLDHFPFSIWRKLSNQSLLPEHKDTYLYGNPQGEPELRKEIAKYLYHSRGVNCSPGQIIIGAGIQQLLTLFGQLMDMKDKSVAIEDPAYDGAKMVFKSLGFNLHPIPLDDKGINVDHLVRSDAKVVYVTPSHQFPYGMILPYAKRLELLQWMVNTNGYIIEDDYDGEFRYIGKPIPALQGLDSAGKVVYLGTFSKALMPALRMSYMVLPKNLFLTFKEKFSAYEPTVSKIHQKTMQLFMENGHWDRHIRKMRKIYQSKHLTLTSGIQNIMGNKVRIIGSQSGLHILLKVNNNMSEGELIESAIRHEVKVYGTSKYWIDKHHTETPMILLGFGGLTEEQIYEGIVRLNKAWFHSS
ncbi:MocR-like pyridoxine biosynthesis transcription factor PdxR [Salinibacillus xinjiangensis]|uniref:Aminotransferase class I/II-fold pyridoxal phosphate-dependent enzyme n=1 Tax=Salinibacillus xinjiangensis TaxID=1229268 RepID=A0A6G1X4S4_9BACI|nr:PLP-dependent aminotransferase family protein [Salinibacillus xinjiangensis]MRG85947.1 aminotransferase class I/II-fold pyridoxal phosphate-dependent enzyme [Salinibacillus xinjiangensis]